MDHDTMNRRASPSARAMRPQRGERDGETVPVAIQALIAERLAELLPLTVEYGDLLEYLRLIDEHPPSRQETRTSPPRAKHGAARESILAALRSGEMLTEAQLAQSTRASPATLAYNLRRLTRLGTIEPVELDQGTGYRLAGDRRDEVRDS